MTRDVSNARADFPVIGTQMNGKPLAFLDSAASAQKPQVVIDAMNAVLESGYSNIHRGLYKISQDLTTAYEAVRPKVASFIGAKSEREIIFTRNTTAAINLVASSWGRANLQKGDEIILTAMEHHANIVPWQMLAQEVGFEIKVVPFDARGVLDMDAFVKLLSDKTKFVGVVHISNALGTINPVEEIVKIAKEYNPDIITLIDGTQSAVHMPVNVQDIGCDFFCFTGHKLYGPTGIGVLYGRADVLADMPPYQGGGDMIEQVSFSGTTYKEPPFRFEAGTPAITEVIGLGAAIDYVQSFGMQSIAAHESEMLGYAEKKLSALKTLKLHSTAPDKAGVISFTMDGIHASDIGMVLDQCGVAVRTGHHCCMPLMAALGVDATTRASIGIYTHKADIDALVSGLKKCEELFA